MAAEREARRGADTLLARLIDNMLALEEPADAPTRSQTGEAGARESAEVAPTRARGRPTRAHPKALRRQRHAPCGTSEASLSPAANLHPTYLYHFAVRRMRTILWLRVRYP